jgi:hypothetical protein
MNKELEEFYVRREDSPVDTLVNLLAMDDDPAKYLVAGHRGGGKTTELRRLERKCAHDYTLFGWIRIRRWTSLTSVMRKWLC